MDPDPGVGLRDTRSSIHDPHSHPRPLSRPSDHDPSTASVSAPTANHSGASSASISSSTSSSTNDLHAQSPARHATPTLGANEAHKTSRPSSPSSEPESLPMTTSSLPQSTLRPNRQGISARHLPLPTSRNPPRQSLRTVSSPLDLRSTKASQRLSQPGHAGQPSVKDLKKRFDQDSTAVSTQRGPPPRSDVPTRLRQDFPRSKPQSNPAAYTNSRVGVASTSLKETQTSSSSPPFRSQKLKYVVQDQVSNNSQSFASRVAKPRATANADSMNSKSMTRLSRKSPPEPSIPQHQQQRQQQQRPHSPSYPFSRSPGLLFGEISPEEHDISTAGFGTQGVRPRRTSDSSVHGLLARRRSLTDTDAKPASPSSWYRSASATRKETSKIHGRSHSDISTPKSPSTIVRKPNPRISLSSTPNLPTPPSRLPVSVRRLNSPTNSSPSSTRSNSPSAHRKSHTNGRPSRASPPASGVKTPTDRKAPPPGLVTPVNNNRLQAYIAERPPKLSPPLRSSRPRQPVSMASTLSSRMKETSKGRSPTHLSANDSLKSGDAERRRSPSTGPIDFEQHREHIRLAYSKSIRESQVIQRHQRDDAEGGRQEMEAPTRASAAAAATAAAVAAEGSPTFKATLEMGEANHQSGRDGANSEALGNLPDTSATDPTLKLVAGPAPGHHTKVPMTSLTISTGIASEHLAALSVDDTDSPTLGMPGGFPDLGSPIDTADRPLSVVSAVTEFDMEPQTESTPIATNATTNISITFTQPANTHLSSPLQMRSGSHGSRDEEVLSPRQLPLAHTPGQSSSSNSAAIMTLSQTGPEQAYQSLDISGPIIPFPRLNPQDDSDCASEIESVPAATRHNSGHEENDDVMACAEEMEERGREEERSSFLFDQPRSASTCASDIETFDDLLYPSYDQPSTFGSSLMLAVPSSRSRVDRTSRQSAWTDFSVDSVDHSDASNSPTMQVTPFPYDHPANPNTADASAHHEASGMGMPFGSMPPLCTGLGQPSIGFGRHNLPGLDTGHGFAAPYLSTTGSESASFLPSPSHDPPPIPLSGSNSVLDSRTSSLFYEQSQYGSTLLNSERESGEFLSHLETPQSLDTTSIETGDQYFDRKTLGDSDAKSLLNQDVEEIDGKERHRLVQRRNVVKELIDTEAVFVRDMNIVEEIYKGTAEACPKLDSKTIKLIFRNSDEIIEFHTSFLAQLKDAVADIYMPKAPRSQTSREESIHSDTSQTSLSDLNDSKDRSTSLGPVFQSNMEKMKVTHEGFLRNSDQAAKRLIQIQQDSTVNVWLNECNEVAKDLTAAWDLDSLLIKPMQRITKYPNLIMTLLQHTPQDHPDREALVAAKDALEEAIIEINKTKKNFELVGQIVGRKRKESDVKAGIARAFGKRVDRLQGSSNRPPEDPEYAKLEERFSDDYLRLQVVLRDVEFYMRQVSAYVHEFLQYLSAIELVMRLQPGNYPELESKWVQFNISIRDLEKVALEQHLAQVRKHVIEPFEQVIKAYGNPSLAMKKRQKRRMVWERSEQLKRAGKTIDPKLRELVEQYEALNETLVKELPKLSALTEKVGNICLGNLINIQTSWYGIWKEKMKTVLDDGLEMPDIEDIVVTFQRDFPYAHEQLSNINIINPMNWRRASQSTAGGDDGLLKARSRPMELEHRGRRLSVNGEAAPVLPTPDFGQRHSGSFTFSSTGSVTMTATATALAAATAVAGGSGGVGGASSPHQQHFREYYTSYQTSLTSPRSVEVSGSSRSLMGTGQGSTRPSTGRSFDSGAVPRRSTESAPQPRRDSSATFHSMSQPHDGGRFSNLFHSALPLPDGPEESQRSSRASSRERSAVDGYNILWLAASLFEFNIATIKHEAGYPYLTYQAGEIFDVIAEKGELWLAKNQDDPTDQVGWIWSKHFAKLADS